MPVLRPLVQHAGGKTELLERIGQLCAGRHPANGVLERARNRLGFHWDYEATVIPAIVHEFTKNQMIVWVEETAPPSPETMHRLANEVLAQGLFPEAGAHTDPVAQRAIIDKAITHVLDAMIIIAEFFAVAVERYLRESGARRRTRE
jgi:hypothetical protein